MKTNTTPMFLVALALIFTGCGKAPSSDKAATTEAAAQNSTSNAAESDIQLAVFDEDGFGVRMGMEIPISANLDRTFTIQACDASNKCKNWWTVACTDSNRSCLVTTADKLLQTFISPVFVSERGRVRFVIEDNATEGFSDLAKKAAISNQNIKLKVFYGNPAVKAVEMKAQMNWDGFN